MIYQFILDLRVYLACSWDQNIVWELYCGEKMLRWRENEWVPLQSGSFSGGKLGEDKALVGGVKPPTESTCYIRGGKIWTYKAFVERQKLWHPFVISDTTD